MYGAAGLVSRARWYDRTRWYVGYSLLSCHELIVRYILFLSARAVYTYESDARVPLRRRETRERVMRARLVSLP
jgi:hypothetical protein